MEQVNKTIKLALLPGDGIGSEVMAEAIKVLDVIGKKYNVAFEYEDAPIGGVAIEKHGESLPQSTIDVAEKADAILFGAVGGAVSDHLKSKHGDGTDAILKLRKHFGLTINVRPTIVFPSMVNTSPLKPELMKDGLDIVVIRELGRGIYFGKPRFIEEVDGQKHAVDTMEYYQSDIEQIGRFAFEIAQKRDKKLVSVDKANVIDCSRLWREVIVDLSKDYTDVELEHQFVDACCAYLVMNPARYSTIVTSNMMGDIVSDLLGGIAGSIGMLPSASFNKDGFGVYEPSGGSAPDIAGKGIANPIAMILSAAMCLKYSFDMHDAYDDIFNAVKKTLDENIRTGDIAAEDSTKVSTSEMGDAIAERL